ncbi:hypothetical protein [Tomitella cavernea]|uniref:Uncharacterized protein n=1 Tax=Tomitella cavernea TaxID=1387982 RepID=A0ABP9BZN3_9ACTN
MDRARVGLPIYLGYEDRWDLLDGDQSAAPVLLPSHYRVLAKGSRVGLPPGHPWREALPDWP